MLFVCLFENFVWEIQNLIGFEFNSFLIIVSMYFEYIWNIWNIWNICVVFEIFVFICLFEDLI